MDRFAENVIDALGRMGLGSVSLGPAWPATPGRLAGRAAGLIRQASPRLDERAQSRIARVAADEGCDVVISLDARLMPSVVAQLKRGGARVAFWFPDHLANMGRALMLLAPYDALFFKEPHLVRRLRAMLDLPVYYLPEACNPRWHRPLGLAGTNQHLVIAGNMYPSRIRLLERLAGKGIPVKVYGTGVPRWAGDGPVHGMQEQRSIFAEEKARIFRAAAGVLNNLHPAEVDGVNARLFEAAGSGAAILTEFRPALPDLFDIGVEVLAFRDFDELVDQATRLFSEPGLTGRLGDAASRRAHRDHTYDRRVADILEKLS
ncbi:MAG: CgeB family protein [Streptosporangiaceae bacterium]